MKQHRRHAGERIALVAKGVITSRTAEPGAVLLDGGAWAIEATRTGHLRIRTGARAAIDLDTTELLAAADRASYTTYDDDFGSPLTAATSVVDGDGNPAELAEGEHPYANERFTVSVTALDGLDGPIHISVHDHHRNPDIAWRLLQRIKNELAGADRWAVEWFPPEDQLVDEANERHLWVWPVGIDPPPWLAMHRGRQVADHDEAIRHGAVQAPLPEWYPEAAR